MSFGLLFVFSILPLCFSTVNHVIKIRKHTELFIPELNSLNSVQKLSNYIDSIYYLSSDSKVIDTTLYVKIASDIIKRRFHHGLSRYSINDNWIASLAGKLFWTHLSAIVKPNDILKHSEGLCSQQTIVFLEMLKLKGINFRTIGLGYKEGPGHYLSEVNYNGTWHLYDVSIEPKWEKVVNHHKSLDYYLQNKDSLFLVYDNRLDKKMFDKIMEKVQYGKLNQFPAKKMLLFHKITLLFTYLLPLFFLFMFIQSFIKIRKLKK